MTYVQTSLNTLGSFVTWASIARISYLDENNNVVNSLEGGGLHFFVVLNKHYHQGKKAQVSSYIVNGTSTL